MKLNFQSVNNAFITDAKLSRNKSGFAIASMYTSNYESLANRLLNSIKDFDNLDYIFFETPTIHRSISPRGTDDTEFCKPNFIAHCLATFKRPILYLDCDVVINKYPIMIEEIIKNGTIDFSIFNWLSEEDNAAYIPKKIRNKSDDITTIYHFSHSINYQSHDQLICSGAVQFWNHTEPSIRLLSKWKSTIENNAGTQDDHCLDYAFNNFDSQIKTYWLRKSYARYAWWIFDEPIIDHPQIPYGGSEFLDLNPTDGTKRVYIDRLIETKCTPQIPQGFILNSNTNELYKLENDNIVFQSKNNLPIWKEVSNY